MSTACLAFPFAAAVTLHNLEEAFFLPNWLRAHGRVRFRPNPTAYWIGTSFLTVLAWIAAAGAAQTPPWRPFPLLLSGFALGVAINAIVPHLAMTLMRRSYMPGTATALLLNLPLAVFLIHAQLRSRTASLASFWLQAVVYAALLGLVAFGLLYLLQIALKAPAE